MKTKLKNAWYGCMVMVLLMNQFLPIAIAEGNLLQVNEEVSPTSLLTEDPLPIEGAEENEEKDKDDLQSEIPEISEVSEVPILQNSDEEGETPLDVLAEESEELTELPIFTTTYATTTYP
jgi:hypothetical protein